nr:hypothetical protein [Endozoicomonas sp. ONNA1]
MTTNQVNPCQPILYRLTIGFEDFVTRLKARLLGSTTRYNLTDNGWYLR